jgi:hypothetical protein
MRKVTSLLTALFLVFAGNAFAQTTDFVFNVPIDLSDSKTGVFNIGVEGTSAHSGARGMSGPYDLDGDGRLEVLISEYSGGGRAHLIENVSADTWELVYSTPWQDSTANNRNARYAVGGDLDGDGNGEIMFVAGVGYSEFNPNIEQLPIGIHIYEYQGANDDYGDMPTKVLVPADPQGNQVETLRAEQMYVLDIDGDGDEELLLPGDSFSALDYFHVYSASGELADAFTFFNQEFAVNPRNNGNALGGGSPFGMVPADLDGDGSYEISLHAWNNFNFFNVDVTGANSYAIGDTTGGGVVNLQAAPADNVALFGGVAADMDGDGNDEVFYPEFSLSGVSGNDVSIMDYSSGDDVLVVTSDNFFYDALPGITGLGLTVGDMDNDGQMELIASGSAYSASAASDGEPPAYVTFVEYQSGDVTDASSYTIETSTFAEGFDSDGSQFNTINRDSAGVMSTYTENGAQGPVFVSKLAYLGDADNDGFNEVALAFQGVDDSTYVISEVWDPTAGDDTDSDGNPDGAYVRTIVERQANPNRAFMRVISGDGFSTSIVDERIVMPGDYQVFTGYPNPFTESTTLGFELPLAKNVSVRIYDVMGREVATLVNDEPFVADVRHEVKWDGTNNAGERVASGTYLYSLEWGNFRKTATLTLVK